MELDSIKDSFESVVKKQKLACSLYKELIDQVGHELEQSLASIKLDNDAIIPLLQRSILTDLKAKLAVICSNNPSVETQQELDINIDKLLKLLEKSFHHDISFACRDIEFDPHIVNQIFVNHLYREGQFDVVDHLLKESGESEPVSLRLQFQEIHQVIEAVKSRNLGPFLNWATANRDIFDLHKLKFIDILQNQTRSDALKYAKTYLAPLAAGHMHELQKLMGSLVWAGKLDKSPYADLVAPIHWEKLLPKEIMRAFCDVTGQSFQNPLKVALAAGMEALPTLLGMEDVMGAKKQGWEDLKQLPIPVELGKEFQFHSIFICELSPDECGKENPPILLPCGHVISQESMNKLQEFSVYSFKCPFCRFTASVSQCKRLYL